MSGKQKYIDFEAYERVAQPHKRERASAWRTAIGLQDVDGLRVSDYLKEIAVKHIEGDITIDEVRKQLQSYYVNKITHDANDAVTEEADRVAANITKLLNEQSFSLTPLAFLNIHRHLFEGIFKHAGVAVGHLDIYSKGGKFRRLYILKNLQGEAKQWQADRDVSSGYIFLNRYGERITTRGIAIQLKHFADCMKDIIVCQESPYPTVHTLLLPFSSCMQYLSIAQSNTQL